MYENNGYVGYEIILHGRPVHLGITTQPGTRLRAHQARFGLSARMRILTSPMSPRQAHNWETLQKRTRGYNLVGKGSDGLGNARADGMDAL